MRLALVGPTHPYKGGIAQHTTELAHRLAGRGHQVDLLSWSAQYPRLLYPGEQRVPGNRPEVPPYRATRYPLAWYRPHGWWFTGRRLRGYDLVVVVMVTPVQAPAYLTLLAALRRPAAGRAARTRRTAPVSVSTPRPVSAPTSAPGSVAVCHNVLPHERTRVDEILVRRVLALVDGVLVHTEAQAGIAEGLTGAPVSVAALPPHPPGGAARSRPADHRRQDVSAPRLLFFGLVRPYKGVDVLLSALAKVPDMTLTIAGEFWGDDEAIRRQVAELGLADRVELRPGYVPAGEVPALFAAADALVLPYRSGTATQNVWLAHAHGRPVIATRAGGMGELVRDGIDGLLCEPGDPDSLAAALGRFGVPGVAERLREGVAPADPEPMWARYLDTLEHLARQR